MVNIRYFWQEHQHIYGHIRRINTVMANAHTHTHIPNRALHET